MSDTFLIAGAAGGFPPARARRADRTISVAIPGSSAQLVEVALAGPSHGGSRTLAALATG
jgi:hypothetical protein